MQTLTLPGVRGEAGSLRSSYRTYHRDIFVCLEGKGIWLYHLDRCQSSAMVKIQSSALVVKM